MDEPQRHAGHSDPAAPITDADIPGDVSVPELDAAIELRRVSFSLLAGVYYGGLEAGADAHRAALVFDKYYTQLRRIFEEASGGLRELWFGGAPGGGLVLTEAGELSVLVPPDVIDLEARQLLDECERLNRDAARTCSKADHAASAREAFDAANHLLDYLARLQEGTVEDRDAELAHLRTRVEWLRANVNAAAQRAAQFRYFGGTILGITIILAIAVSISIATRRAGTSSVDVPALVVTAVAGGLGAWISVLYRFSFGRVKLDTSADPVMIRRLGTARPLIGSVLALAIYCLIGSGILPLEVPSNRTAFFLFIAFAGFLSGFSERWAQDMLVIGESHLRGRASQSKAQSNAEEGASGRTTEQEPATNDS